MSKFWKIITLKAKKESKYRKMVAEQFNETSLRSIVDKYEANCEQLKKAQKNVADAVSARSDAKKLVDRFDELNTWEFNFEGIVREEARGLLMKNFEALSVDSIVAKAPIEARVKAAKLHALAKKHEYTSNLKTYLKTEIDDRQQRVASISRVRNKWRRNPSGSVRGDKTKWLQGIPAMKAEGTRKRLGWSQRMRGSIGSYNDYGAYGAYYYSSSMHHHGFLAYDVFNTQGSSRMPHESFSNEVLPEIGQFREDHTTSEWIDAAVLDEALDLGENPSVSEDEAILADDIVMGDFSEDIDGDIGAEVSDADGVDFGDMDSEVDAIESMIDDEPDDAADIDDAS